MKRRLYAPAVLVIGLLSAQAVAIAHVYLSNLNLLQATGAVMRAGYLSVPNTWVAERLPSLATAMAGGVFFTLSIGAGLSLASLTAVWFWDRVFQRNLKATVVIVLVWLSGLACVNDNGWNPIATAYCLVVPLVTIVAAIRLLPPRTSLLSPARVLWPVSAAIVLALMWGLVMDRHLFTNIRDYLLLGNRVGQAITDAYYTHTLFPAEAFKSLAQKQIRTCVLDSTLDHSQRFRLERIFRSHDYLPLPAGYPSDLIVGQDNRNKVLVFRDRNHEILRISESNLVADPGSVLADFSQKTDRNRMFRRLTLTFLLLGFPLVLFTFAFCFIGCLPNLFLNVNLSNVIAAVACVLAGGILLIPVYQGHSAETPADDLDAALTADDIHTRVVALRQAYTHRQDISAEARRHKIPESTHAAERYWLARSLAYANRPAARATLLNLMDDPVAIVACQALWALGQRQDRAAIPAIIERIQTTSHWYIQMYGYRALRTLGWVQPRSPQLSY